MLGARSSLALSIVAMLVAFACFARAAMATHRETVSARPLETLAVAAAVWLAVLVPWLIKAPGLSRQASKRAMYAALGAWALTDIAVLLATS